MGSEKILDTYPSSRPRMPFRAMMSLRKWAGILFSHLRRKIQEKLMLKLNKIFIFTVTFLTAELKIDN
jgi:hypothetical protein